MADSDRLNRFLRTKLRNAGKQVEEARHAFSDGKSETLSETSAGEKRIVCRRYAEKRTVRLDEESRPHCFEADHPDCEGCVEDIRTQDVETW